MITARKPGPRFRPCPGPSRKWQTYDDDDASETDTTANASQAAAEKARIRYDEPEQFTTFTCFPKLPIELKLKIWGHAADQDKATIALLRARTKENLIKKFVCHRGGRRVPALLHTCWEARIECLEGEDPLKKVQNPAMVIDAQEGQVSAIDAALLALDTSVDNPDSILATAGNKANTDNDMAEIKTKSEHARWKLYTFENYRDGVESKQDCRVFFNPNDTFWAGDLSRASFARNPPFASSLRHYADSGRVWNLDELVDLVRAFPNLETVTRVLQDHHVYAVPGKQLGRSRRAYKYYNLQPEVGGQLSMKGLTAEEKTIVQSKIERTKVPRIHIATQVGITSGGLPALGAYVPTEEENKAIHMLRFRFESQFTRAETPKLYKRKNDRKR